MNQIQPSDNEVTRFLIGCAQWTAALAVLALLSTALPAQNVRNVPAKPAPAVNQRANQSEMEPVAMQALKVMSDQLRGVNSFSFTARVMREEPGTNGQMLDFFRNVTVQVQRPDKMRINVNSGASDVNVWYDGRRVTFMPVSGKLYSTMPAPATLDATLTMLKDKLNTHTPLRPFLSSDPYAILADGVESANEIGYVNAGNEQLLHLAFMEPDADWQLWLTGPNQVLPRRMAIVYKKIEGQPRVDIDFSNWCLNAEIPDSAFVFSKPQGAVQTNLTALRPGTNGQGGKTQ